MKDKTLLPDALLSVAFTVTMLCVLRNTVVIVFPPGMILGIVLLWHVALAVVDRLKPSPMLAGTLLFILAAMVILYAARIGAEGAEGSWLSGYLRWATQENVQHNDTVYWQYRMATLGMVSFVFSLALFLLIRCEAHIGLMMMVGTSIFLGMQWAEYEYAPMLLWSFLFLILSASLRQGLWKGGQQGLQMLCAAPLCALILLAVSAFPLDEEPLGQRILDRFSLLPGISSDIDWGPFAFFKAGQTGDATDIRRDLGGPFEPDTRTLLYLRAEKPLYMKARSARIYTGRRWEPDNLPHYTFTDTLFQTAYPHYPASFTHSASLEHIFGDASEAAGIQAERYQLPATLSERLDWGRDDPRLYSLKRATVYYWEM
ncbi:MAG: hypothetical protein FWG93_03025, partial [Oscillospiraceae bacterium]|nr:hypothetical protein [Oscillospiraceae bacterium]